MPESPQTTPDQYGPFARAFTIAANLLQDVDREAWTARGLGPFDVPAAQAWAGILLYAYSIELGLKDILARRMETRVPKVHDLVQLWERLTDEWRKESPRSPASRWQTSGKPSGVLEMPAST